jgi:hypothetical protein
MEIIEIPKDRFNEIEPLWRYLNTHHHERSNNFKDHFSAMMGRLAQQTFICHAAHCR